MLALIPWTWNGCGKVAFDATAGSNYKNCVEQGADLSNCFNPNPSVLREQSSSINVKANADVDILFVVDNSGSMTEEQQGIGNKINGFLSKIAGLNWQIALTTTDVDGATTKAADGTPRAWSDGQFRPFDSDTGSQFILRSSQVSAANAQTMLSNAIQVGIVGSGNERGIAATYRAIERSAVPSTQRDFFRPNAKLAVILISDEDECSNGNCGANANMSVPQNLVNLVKSQLGQNKGFAFSSIVKIPGDAACTTGSNTGNIYKSITDLTNGLLGSVCATDYTSPLSQIGSKVVELVNSATLSCNAEDLNGDGKGDVTIKLAGGGTMTSGYNVVGSQVTFSNALPEGTHSFYYFCK